LIHQPDSVPFTSGSTKQESKVPPMVREAFAVSRDDYSERTWSPRIVGDKSRLWQRPRVKRFRGPCSMHQRRAPFRS